MSGDSKPVGGSGEDRNINTPIDFEPKKNQMIPPVGNYHYFQQAKQVHYLRVE